MVLWLVVGAALVVAVVALRRARRTSERLDHLAQMYWELKYQHGELRQQVAPQLDARADREGADQAPVAPHDTQSGSFVPLASLKR